MRSYLNTLALLFITHSLSAQGLDNYLPRVVLPSPDAAALGKYADYPISHYNGTVDISIPLYTIEINGFELPISLSYHSSGIKASEQASWVGLGWVLNAGGVVNQNVMGFEDFSTRIGHLSYLIPDVFIDYSVIYGITYPDQGAGGCTTCPEFPLLGYVDFDPDIFSFNFNGRTGKFMYTQEGVPISFPHQDLKVADIDYAFEIIDENGIKYTFDKTEETKCVRVSDAGGVTSDKTVYTAYYLGKITLPNGKEINFEYLPENYGIEGPISYSAKANGVTDNITGGLKTQDFSDIKGLYLSRITWDNNRIEFTTAGRTDFSAPKWGWIDPDAPGPKRVTGLTVYNSDGIVKSFEFTQSYFNQSQGANYERLRLDQVVEKSSDGQYLEPYIFSYDDGTLPIKTGLGDYWGYIKSSVDYPGIPSFAGYIKHEDESYLTPLSSSLTDELLSGKFFNFHGKDREPEFPAMRAGTLTSIEYPTGGRTDFEYEAHNYTSIFTSSMGVSMCEYREKSYFTSVYNGSTISSGSFTIPDKTSIKLSFEIGGLKVYGPENEPITAETGDNLITELCAGNKIRILNSGGTEIITVYWCDPNFPTGKFCLKIQGVNSGALTNVSEGILTSSNNNPGVLYVNNLPSGTYTLEITRDVDNTDSYINATVTYIEQICSTSKTAGGLRIKNKTDYDNNGSVLYKVKYDYDGGILYNMPKFYSVGAEIHNPFYTPHCEEIPIYKRYLDLNSGAINPITSGKGNHIGYNTVTATEINPQDIAVINGYIKFDYDNDPFNYYSYSFGKTFFVGADVNLPFDDEDIYGGWVTFEERTNGEPAENIMFAQTFPYSEPTLIDDDLGNLNSTTYYNKYSKKVKSISNSYVITIKNILPAFRGYKIPYDHAGTLTCTQLGKRFDFSYGAWFDYYSCTNQLTGTTTTDYDVNEVPTTQKVTSYSYEGSNHSMLTRIQETASDNSLLTRKLIYPPDYSDITTGFIGEMKTANIINKPIEQYTVKNVDRVTAGTLTTYKTGVDVGLPDKFYKLQTETFLYLNTEFRPSNSGGYFPDQHYNTELPPEISYDEYESGNVLQYHLRYGPNTAIIWGYNNSYPIAKVENAKYDEIFFTSFEDNDFFKNWLLEGEGDIQYSTDSHTGNRSIIGDNHQIGKENLQSGIYKLSYWAKNGVPYLLDYPPFINGVNILSETTGMTINGWTYYEKEINSTETENDLILKYSGLLDEIRIYPESAQMTTYTYDPLIGVTSITDQRNQTTYYEYDAFGRLQFIKDYQGYIRQKYDYHYAP